MSLKGSNESLEWMTATLTSNKQVQLVEIQYFELRSSQHLDFQWCYTHKKMKIYVEKATVSIKYGFCEEIN